MTGRKAWLLLGITAALGWCIAAPAQAGAEREKLLNDPGVYATFAVFKVEPEWWALDQPTRAAGVAEVRTVVQKHGEKIAVDAYLLRGLSDQADFFFRLHAGELLLNQNFLLEIMGTSLGKRLTNTLTLNGMTKKATYVPGFPEELKAALKLPTDPGAKPYAIVVPIRKDADWWLLDQQARTALMKEHTEASLPYLKTVKRKLYHATGLDDLDFITYFETARLDDFHSLIIALQQVKENKHNRRFGHPILLGTSRPLEEVLEPLAR